MHVGEIGGVRSKTFCPTSWYDITIETLIKDLLGHPSLNESCVFTNMGAAWALMRSAHASLFCSRFASRHTRPMLFIIYPSARTRKPRYHDSFQKNARRLYDCANGLHGTVSFRIALAEAECSDYDGKHWTLAPKEWLRNRKPQSS